MGLQRVGRHSVPIPRRVSRYSVPTFFLTCDFALTFSLIYPG